MGWTVTLPAAWANLVTGLRGWAALAGVQVKDGAEITDPSVYETVTVGFTDETAPDVVDAANSAGGMVNQPGREQYVIQCGVSVQKGTAEELPDARARAFELLDAVVDYLTANKTLGGAVMNATLGEWHLRQYLPQNAGAVATIAFGVNCDAFTGRV